MATSSGPLPFDGGIFSAIGTFPADVASGGGASRGHSAHADAQAADPAAGVIDAAYADSPWRNASVRDLAWLLQSPALLSATRFPGQLADPTDPAIFGPAASAQLLALLQRLDADPHVLEAALSAHAERRLGRYAERLLAQWLARVPDTLIIALSLAVRSRADAASAPALHGRTLGECDALFETAIGAREHWEMAVKFYLYVGDGEGEASQQAGGSSLLKGCDAFVGAGLADRFDWKLHRLIAHQLPLSDHPELLAMAPGPWQARMFVKGRLFYPLAQWRAFSPVAPALALNHARGWWATLDTWLAWSRTTDCHWTSLARLDWLAPLQVTGERISNAADFAHALCQHFDGKKGDGEPGADRTDRADRAGSELPWQVAALRPANGTGPALELSRGFIVPNTWPARAMRFRSHHQ